MKNERIIQALLRQPVDTTPVWMMRQAGRYLPEFRAARAKVPDFLQFCKTPELACEVTLQPIERFGFDAAIIFSDILTVVDALGFNLTFDKGVGPVVHNPVASWEAVSACSVEQALSRLEYVSTAVRITARALQDKVPLIGFAGSPWTVACYMVQGRNADQFEKIRVMAYHEPKLLHALLRLLTEVTVAYLDQQIAAGAEIIMLFDSWGGILSPLQYQTFSLHYMTEIGRRIQRVARGKPVPLIFFTKQGGLWLESIAAAGCDAVGLDWSNDLGRARARVGEQVALQGCLDPLALFGTPATVRAEVQRLLASYGKGTGLVFNLGHGIDKSTPVDNVYAMVEAVREFGVCAGENA